MRKNDFITIHEEIIKKAEEVISASSQNDILRKFKIYKSYLKQLTQIIKEVEDKAEIADKIESVNAINKKVVEKLASEKEGLFKNIRSGICREHIRKKYYSNSQKSSLINKKT